MSASKEEGQGETLDQPAAAAAQPAPSTASPSADVVAAETPAAAQGGTQAPAAGVAPIVHGNDEAIEPRDAEGTETDSAYGESSTSYTTSLTSSITDYQYENGRRYHAYRAGQYVMPNDQKEQDRLDLSYHIFRMVLGGRLYCAPIGDKPQRVLDIGTGTGIWAIDFADQFPSAEVIGTDLSAIQTRWVPPNLRFQIDDAESEWTFPISQPFDYIRLRSMGGSIADWPRLFAQAYAHLAPGAWIEVVDSEAWASTDDDSLPETSDYAELQRRLDEASRKFGRRMNVAAGHKEALEKAGFVDVVDEVRKTPLSPWPKDHKLKEIGRFTQLQMIDAVESYGLALLTRVLGWDVERTQVLIAGARQDLRNYNYHMFSRLHCVYGQKPKI